MARRRASKLGLREGGGGEGDTQGETGEWFHGGGDWQWASIPLPLEKSPTPGGAEGTPDDPILCQPPESGEEVLPNSPCTTRLFTHGGSWRNPQPGYRPGVNAVNLFASGVMLPLAVEAGKDLAGDELFVNVINVTSPDLLHRSWVNAGRSRIEPPARVAPSRTTDS